MKKGDVRCARSNQRGGEEGEVRGEDEEKEEQNGAR